MNANENQGPLAPPPPDSGNPLERSQFHTILKRISREPGGGYSLAGAPPPPPPPPPAVVQHVQAPVGQDDLDATYPADPSMLLGMADEAETSPGGAQEGHMVALFGCKGGVGNTFVAVNLAAELARRHNVCLVDMDLQMGDVLVSMNMDGRCAISHLIRDIRDEGDSFNPRSVLDRHEGTGVYVLSQVHWLEELDLLKPTEIGHLFSFLKKRFHFVVVDGLRSFDDNSMFVLDAADTILLVVQQDVPSVRSAARSMEIFRRVGYDDSKVVVVVNRFYKKALVTPKYVSESLQLDRVATIRHDFKTVIKSLNEGRPLLNMAPQAKITADLAGLARLIKGGEEDQSPQAKGLLSNLRFWKKG